LVFRIWAQKLRLYCGDSTIILVYWEKNRSHMRIPWDLTVREIIGILETREEGLKLGFATTKGREKLY